MWHLQERLFPLVTQTLQGLWSRPHRAGIQESLLQELQHLQVAPLAEQQPRQAATPQGQVVALAQQVGAGQPGAQGQVAEHQAEGHRLAVGS